VDLELSDDQVALRDGIASMLASRVPIERVRAGFDRALFDELAEAGVFSLRNDGFSWADCAVVLEQLGRSCVPGPLVPSLLLGDGRIATFYEHGWVEHLDVADVVIVASEDEAHVAVCAASEIGEQPSHWPLDPATPITHAGLDLPPLTPLELEWDAYWTAGAALTAAFQLGLADRLTEMSVAYAKERQQFDRPIGAFQAIKHLLADMVVRTEVARAAVYAAATGLDEDPDPRAVSVAKALAGEAAIVNGKTATQVHGGMGFTWEVDVHLYMKRAWVLDTHFGSVDTHCDIVAATAAPLPTE